MDAIKIDNFRRSHRDVQFPAFESLEPSGCANLRQLLASRLGLQPGATPLEITETLYEQAGVALGSATDVDGLDIRIMLGEAGVEVGDQIYVNWYRFDDIDEMGIDELSRYFGDIWYPASDDVDLFDHTLYWVLSVSHGGRIVLRRLVVP